MKHNSTPEGISRDWQECYFPRLHLHLRTAPTKFGEGILNQLEVDPEKLVQASWEERFEVEDLVKDKQFQIKTTGDRWSPKNDYAGDWRVGYPFRLYGGPQDPRYPHHQVNDSPNSPQAIEFTVHRVLSPQEDLISGILGINEAFKSIMAGDGTLPDPNLGQTRRELLSQLYPSPNLTDAQKETQFYNEHQSKYDSIMRDIHRARGVW